MYKSQHRASSCGSIVLARSAAERARYSRLLHLEIVCSCGNATAQLCLSTMCKNYKVKHSRKRRSNVSKLCSASTTSYLSSRKQNPTQKKILHSPAFSILQRQFLLMTQQEQPPNKWLTAHFDPKASLNAVSTCMALADLNGDGDYKLVLADCGAGSQFGMKLKVYKGSSLISENTIIDTPTAICTFFMDQSSSGGPGRVPAVALASGCCLYVYKNLKPYYKFTLPGLSMDEREKEIWERARIGKINANLMSEALETLKGPVPQRFTLPSETLQSERDFSMPKGPLKRNLCKGVPRTSSKGYFSKGPLQSTRREKNFTYWNYLYIFKIKKQ
uniref:Bardet-Biedl syndrome 1 N-terminal domain-containing protein n=1 Tax=Romanomermis culicivorax TaxID=13658 RepID=A0A915LDC0_ROMCU